MITAESTRQGVVLEAADHAGQTLYAAAASRETLLPSSCGQVGTCKECVVAVVGGADNLTQPTKYESHLGPPYRLACQAVVGDRQAEIIVESPFRGSMAITEWIPPSHPVPPTQAATSQKYDVAVDLGTTSVVVQAVSGRGVVVDSRTFENPQAFGGSDVMSRIAYESRQRLKPLQKVVLGYLRDAIESLDCGGDRIDDVVVAGNTTMRDILFGIDVSPIGQKPYRSSIEESFRNGDRDTSAVIATAEELGLSPGVRGEVRSLPLISGHVGSDAMACALAIGLPRRTDTVALMDIGTNTEVIIASEGQIAVASCPAGPAFEGGGISHGMTARPGAISSVGISEEGQLQIATIAEGSPVGICGSGLIDALAVLRRAGGMDHFGRLSNGPSVALAPGVELTEGDISELAQAKAAHVAAFAILLDFMDLSLDNIDRLFLAGGFATHLSARSAVEIGLLPNLPIERFEIIGNGALGGAIRTLIDPRALQDADEIARRAVHVELESHPQFFEMFVEGCLFGRSGE